MPYRRSIALPLQGAEDRGDREGSSKSAPQGGVGAVRGANRCERESHQNRMRDPQAYRARSRRHLRAAPVVRRRVALGGQQGGGGQQKPGQQQQEPGRQGGQSGNRNPESLNS
jgi:hypothetical protein